MSIPTTEPSSLDPTCPRSVEVADRWLDGFEQGEIRRHVAECPKCAATADRARRTRRVMLAAFPAPALADSAFIWDQVDRLIALRRMRWLLATIATLALIGLLVWMR